MVRIEAARARGDLETAARLRHRLEARWLDRITRARERAQKVDLTDIGAPSPRQARRARARLVWTRPLPAVAVVERVWRSR